MLIITNVRCLTDIISHTLFNKPSSTFFAKENVHEAFYFNKRSTAITDRE